MSRLTLLNIPPAKAGATLSPQQKRFNTLLRQIEKARETLATWQENVALFRQADAAAMTPLRQELRAALRQWLFALDALLAQPGWTNTQRETMRNLICEDAGALAASTDDAEVRALFDKHAEVDFDTEQRERRLAMKALAEEVTGLDLGEDEGIDSEEVLFARMREGFAQQGAREQAEREARAARKPKTAAQQRREAEAQQATQSLREIYRKLASALHPDREPDEAERAAKTQLMQRVNQAYAAGDLLALLELQLRVEQIDAAHVATASESRLKHYNQVLAEQLHELKERILEEEVTWKMDFHVPEFAQVDPRRLGEYLEQGKRDCRAEIARLQKELRMFADVPSTRRWLKKQRDRLADQAFDLPF